MQDGGVAGMPLVTIVAVGVLLAAGCAGTAPSPEHPTERVPQELLGAGSQWLGCDAADLQIAPAEWPESVTRPDGVQRWIVRGCEHEAAFWCVEASCGWCLETCATPTPSCEAEELIFRIDCATFHSG